MHASRKGAEAGVNTYVLYPGTVEVMHVEPAHVSPLGHTVPQLPQLFGSDVVSVQPLLHIVRGETQPAWHAPALHTPPEHTFPQKPQLFGSARVLMQTAPHIRSGDGHTSSGKPRSPNGTSGKVTTSVRSLTDASL
jgi:hypothetical protein